MNHYEAKFERERKDNPSEWIIAPAGRYGVKLVHIGPPRKYTAPVATVGKETSVPYMRVVK